MGVPCVGYFLNARSIIAAHSFYSFFSVFDNLQLNNVNFSIVYCIHKFGIPKQTLDFSA